MAAHDFLFELGVEEMPPKALETLSIALLEGITKGLQDAGIAGGKVRRFATPRRLAVLIENLTDRDQVGLLKIIILILGDHVLLMLKLTDLL